MMAAQSMRRAFMLILTGLMLAWLLPLQARAQDTPPTWEVVGVGKHGVDRLYAPVSGALFAVTWETVMRSDDGGTTWRPMPGPKSPTTTLDIGTTPLSGRFGIDPTNHAFAYILGRDILYRTQDDATNWSEQPTAQAVHGMLEVSSADPSLLYAAYTEIDSVWWSRSQDAGATWQHVGGVSCSESRQIADLDIMRPHPTDATTVYGAWACSRGSQVHSRLARSTNRGKTWETIWSHGASLGLSLHRTAQQASPIDVVIGFAGPAAPLRMFFGGGPFLNRSDQAGPASTSVLDARTLGGPRSEVSAVAVDPGQPDRVFVGIQHEGHAEILVTTDGGQIWVPFGAGQDQLVRVYDLAVGVDGATLYAALQSGVGRVPLR